MTHSVAIAESLEQAARCGLERRWINNQFETVGSDDLTNIVFEVVSQDGADWIWKEDPVVGIADVTFDSIDKCEEFWGECTGERLPSEEVARARANEIDVLRQYGVYEKVSAEEC